MEWSRTRLAGGVRARVLWVFLLAWLAWRSGAGALSLLAELRSTDPRKVADALAASEDARLAHTLERQDRRQGFPEGTHLGLFHALVEHVEPAGVIYVPARFGHGDGRKLAVLRNLLAPRTFRPVAEPALGALPSAGAVLDFDDELRARLETRRSAVAHGADWTLWR